MFVLLRNQFDLQIACLTVLMPYSFVHTSCCTASICCLGTFKQTYVLTIFFPHTRISALIFGFLPISLLVFWSFSIWNAAVHL